MATQASDGSHRWRFYRAGGVDQVRIDTGADIFHLDALDPKLWVALSCPVKGLEFDERTLALLDTDKDGRVRLPEVLTAVTWLRKVLKSGDSLIGGKDGVALSELNDATPEGKRLLGAARLVLKSLGRDGAGTLTVDDATKTADVFVHARHNGDGVVPPAFVEDAQARRVADEMVTCLGGVPDRSGQPGFDAALIQRFLAECEAFSSWWAKGEGDKAAIWPLGEKTADAAAAYEAVRAKVDDYFERTRLAAFDPRARAAVNRTEADYAALASKSLASQASAVADLPLALVEPSAPLAFGRGINPAWQEWIERFRAAVVGPLLGADRASISRDDWLAVSARLAPHRAWRDARAGGAVERLGAARVREILAGTTKAALEAEIAADLAVAGEVEALAEVERITRLHRDLHRLLNNFVSFTDFYARRMAIFQSGTLFLDGRSSDLCVAVNDAGKHGTIATMARTYLVYVDCTRPSGEKMTVAAAITAGDRDNLFVGRNGLFFDRRGRDWDASISKIVDHPISVGQAFWAPYKKVLRWIEDSVAKRAAAADDAASTRLQAAAAPSVAGAPAPAAPAGPRIDIGVVAALGVAVGGIASAVGLFMQSLFGLGIFMPLGFLGLLLLISGPSMLIAYLKLRQRNLGPILDANGWAVNTLTRINLPLGRSLTSVAELPPGAERSFADPYAERKRRWPLVLFLLLLLAAIGAGLWKTGLLSKWIPRIPPPEHPWSIDGEKKDAAMK